VAKAVLTIEAEYDEKATDPDSLASAVNILLQTALSTPGVLKDLGELHFGEFAARPPDDESDTSNPVVAGNALPTRDEAEGDEEPIRFRNHYKCPRCGTEWTDEWSCACNDACPQCDMKDIMPVRSEDI
jgi:DNA-directed RNA polymerase subunit RPC12/RpoP